MAIANGENTISKASPHTIKKFDLIEKYVETWAQKLLNTAYCSGIVFIDCMCNSGLYYDDNGNRVEGTPIRISKVLRDAAGQYPKKKIYVYLNDYSPSKIETLKENLPSEKNNFKYSITSKDGNDLLREIGPKLSKNKTLHYFLLYDPFEATIDWTVLAPFFRSWDEVMINHMVSDSVRAIKQVRSQEAKEKYEGTYLSKFEDLLPCGSNKDAYEQRVEEIILSLKGSAAREYYISAYPFFNTRNSLLYDLIHCTSNREGFRLYKTTAWKTFGGKSSTKNPHGEENQIMIDFEGSGALSTKVDERCYYIKDVVDYIQHHFAGQENVPFDDIWALLDEHPVFPYNGYRNVIKRELEQDYGAKKTRTTITFSDRR